MALYQNKDPLPILILEHGRCSVWNQYGLYSLAPVPVPCRTTCTHYHMLYAMLHVHATCTCHATYSHGIYCEVKAYTVRQRVWRTRHATCTCHATCIYCEVKGLAYKTCYMLHVYMCHIHETTVLHLVHLVHWGNHSTLTWWYCPLLQG